MEYKGNSFIQSLCTSLKQTKTFKIMKKLKIIFAILFLHIFFVSSSIHAQELELEYEFLCEVTALLDNPIEIGNTPLGKRTIHPITGGSFEGPKIKGKVFKPILLINPFFIIFQFFKNF